MTENLPVITQVIFSILIGVLVSLFAVIAMYLISSAGYLIINLLKKDQLKPIVRGNFILKVVILVFFIFRLIIRSLSPYILSYGEPLSFVVLGAYVIEPISFFYLSSLFKDMRKMKSGVIYKSQQDFEQVHEVLTCNKCKNEIDSDSLFCQFCGNEILLESTKVAKNGISRTQKKINVALIFAWIIAFISLLACISLYSYFINRISSYELQITLKDKEIENLESNYKEKANYFDKIVNKAGIFSNTNFFASNTVLRNPINTRVVFYIDYSGQYSISAVADLGVMTTFGNTSSGLVYADISFFGKGVKTVTFTNDYNNEEILIYCIGS